MSSDGDINYIEEVKYTDCGDDDIRAVFSRLRGELFLRKGEYDILKTKSELVAASIWHETKFRKQHSSNSFLMGLVKRCVKIVIDDYEELFSIQDAEQFSNLYSLVENWATYQILFCSIRNSYSADEIRKVIENLEKELCCQEENETPMSYFFIQHNIHVQKHGHN